MRGYLQHKIPLALLDRVVAGEASVEERAHLFQAIAATGQVGEPAESVIERLRTANDRNRPSADDLQRAVRALRTAVVAEEIRHGTATSGTFSVPETSETVRRSVSEHVRTRPSRSMHAQRSTRSAGLGRFARFTAVGIVAVTAVAIWIGGRGIADLLPSASDTRADASGREYQTHRGQRATIDLPDGSRVVLAPETRLQYRVAARGARVVELVGQAYFTVTHDPERPFSVHTGTVETRVLGTAFGVRAYPTDRTAAQVVVADGKVAFGERGESTILLAGDVGRIVANQRPTVTRDTKTGDAFGWLHGQVSVDDVPLRDAVVELERLYDLDITVADARLAAKPVNVPATNQPARAVLESIALAVGATLTQHGHTVVLSAK